MHQQQQTPRVLSTMLIAAAVILPLLAVPAILITRRFLWVHYTPHTMLLWLLLDAAILFVGLILRENESLADTTSTKRNTRRMR